MDEKNHRQLWALTSFVTPRGMLKSGKMITDAASLCVENVTKWREDVVSLWYPSLNSHFIGKGFKEHGYPVTEMYLGLDSACRAIVAGRDAEWLRQFCQYFSVWYAGEQFKHSGRPERSTGRWDVLPWLASLTTDEQHEEIANWYNTQAGADSDAETEILSDSCMDEDSDSDAATQIME